MKRTTIKHEFVEFVPGELQEGTLYISIPYEMAVHLCACGCGIKVVTPISPPEWRLIWDGDTVSLYPSIGNWQFPCRSHYWIRSNRVEWARAWSEREILESRRRDAEELEEYFADKSRSDSGHASTEPAADPQRPSILHRLRRLLRSR
jgi:Family of unknown function (DUF6527)